MEQQRLARRPILPPDLDSLSTGLVTRLAHASVALGELQPVSTEKAISAPAAALARLRHPLSDAYLSRNGRVATAPRTDVEAAALKALGSALDPEDRGSFVPGLKRANELVTNGGGGWRGADICTAPDQHGNSIVFPQRRHVAEQVERTREVLLRRDAPAIFKAAIALALLTNCHPFRDGNGRVARMVFNYALRSGGMPDTVYIAFSELAARSDGGYLIALRQGELRGEWEPFLEFALTMIEVHCALAHLDLADGDAA